MELDLSRGMLKLFKLTILIFSVSLYANTNSYNFELVKKGMDNNNTLLVVGGIQGDEPGGFMAASLLSTHYDITKGSVWIVPNLNFYSIIKRSRGPYGDMNRKFADLSQKDPEYHIVDRIKGYIEKDNVKLIVNLHDGSGFFRYKYIDKLHSPYRWGQCSIIDQEKINSEYGNLKEISGQICNHVNNYLIKPEHEYRLHNTKTAQGDKEMAKTLTFFAINKGKAAFGNEASKELPTHERVYYHLLALEKYMHIMGIEFKRKFTLSPKEVKDVLDNDISISFYDDKITLPLSEIKNIVKYFPTKKNGEIDFVPSSPIMTVIKKGDYYTIQYGNRRIAKLTPDYFDIDNSTNETITFEVDGDTRKYQFGSVIDVKNDFLIYPNNDFRVNVIGYVNKKYPNEKGIKIKKIHILKRYSIDKKGKLFRVEFYKKDKNNKEKFAGMIIVRFDKYIKESSNQIQNFVYGENKIIPNS